MRVAVVWCNLLWWDNPLAPGPSSMKRKLLATLKRDLQEIRERLEKEAQLRARETPARETDKQTNGIG